jgi:hypothetical protein
MGDESNTELQGSKEIYGVINKNGKTPWVLCYKSVIHMWSRHLKPDISFHSYFKTQEKKLYLL